jgi:hypothetical protein
VAAVVGVALRAWFLAHHPITSDEAIVGLMARGILHGHFWAFYWGQHYGGVEPYLVAGLFGLFGASGVLIELTAATLSALAAVLTWRVARRLVADRRLALLMAALAWVAPEAWVHTSTYEYGFRGVTLVAGLASMLFALRILDGAERERASKVDFAALGLAAGLGWWASPEVGYFLVPAALILVGALARRLRPPAPLRTVGLGLTIMVVGFVVGALPWIWANVRSGLASLSSSSFDSHPPLDFAGRLRVFVRLSALIELNLKLAGNGHRVMGTPGASVGLRLLMDAFMVVVLVALAGALVLCLVRGGRAVAVVVAVVIFPLLYAASPATWYWEDGRYATYLGPLVAMMLAIGIEEAMVRFRRSAGTARGSPWRSAVRSPAPGLVGPAIMAGVVAVSALSTLAAFHQGTGLSASAFFQRWGDPDRANERAVSNLEANGITRGYADYWVAYNVDFFSRNRMQVTTISNEVDRSASINREARRGRGQAWLFEVPYNGPTGILEPSLVDAFLARHIAFRVIHAGRITAVVPSAVVTPAQGLDDAKT